MASKPGKNSRRTLGIVLTVVFVIALIMGPVPGILLVNRPEPLLGLPAVYLWGLAAYVVEVGVVVLAYLFVWSDDADEASFPSG